MSCRHHTMSIYINVQIWTIQSLKSIIVIKGNSIQSSHMKQSLTHPRMGLVRFPSCRTPKEFVRLLEGLHVHKAPGLAGAESV